MTPRTGNAGPRSIPLGRWFGVPVGAHWSVVLALAIITQIVAVTVLPATAPGHPMIAYWSVGAASAVAFLVSLLAHELAHSVVAKRHDVGVRRVDLWLLGGTSQLTAESPTPRIDFLIAIAGPATSLACAGLAIGTAAVAEAAGLPALAIAPLVWLAITNTVLGVFNLAPAAPLDGGRVLRAAVWRRTGDRLRAETVATKAGRTFGAILVLLGVMEVVGGALSGFWLALMGWFLMTASRAEQVQTALRERLGDTRVRDIMTTDPATAPGWWTARAFLERVTAGGRGRVFPVVSFEGVPLGLVSLAELTRLPAEDRFTTRVADVSRPLADVPTAAPDDRVLDVLTRTVLLPGKDVVVVVRDGAVVGTVSSDDVARAIELAPAGASTPKTALKQ